MDDVADTKPPVEAVRLEQLWKSEFGDQYTERNEASWQGREAFWNEFLADFPCDNVLEVGCNAGANLHWIARKLRPPSVYGVEINERALEQARQRLPGVNALWGVARALPFRDGFFDLTFTTGVLIHQPPAVLPLVMSEIVRCSRRWVLCGEYHSDSPIEIPYRGQSAALFKRDFGGMYEELFPELQLRRKGFLPRGSGWDDVTYWVFERRR